MVARLRTGVKLRPPSAGLPPDGTSRLPSVPGDLLHCRAMRLGADFCRIMHTTVAGTVAPGEVDAWRG
jgi:hypothetical protein